MVIILIRSFMMLQITIMLVTASKEAVSSNDEYNIRYCLLFWLTAVAELCRSQFLYVILVITRQLCTGRSLCMRDNKIGKGPHCCIC